MMIREDTSRFGMDEGNRIADAPASRGATDGEAQSSGGVMDAARDKIQQLASQARDTASEQFESRFTSGKSRATGTLGSIAQSLHSTSQQMRDQEQSGIGEYAEQAAGKVEELSQYLENSSLNDIATRVEAFARREPALFIGGALALGFMSARFLKSSQRNQLERSGMQSSASLGQSAGGMDGDVRTGDSWRSARDREVTSETLRDWPSDADGEARGETNDRIGLA